MKSPLSSQVSLQTALQQLYDEICLAQSYVESLAQSGAKPKAGTKNAHESLDPQNAYGPDDMAHVLERFARQVRGFFRTYAAEIKGVPPYGRYGQQLLEERQCLQEINDRLSKELAREKERYNTLFDYYIALSNQLAKWGKEAVSHDGGKPHVIQ